MIKRFATASLFLIFSACASTNPPPVVTPPAGKPMQFTVVVCAGGSGDYCTNVPKVAGAKLLIDATQVGTTNANGFAGDIVTRGSHAIEITADGCESKTFTVTMVDPYHRDVKLNCTPATPPISRLRVEGRFFVNDHGTYRPRWTSGLALLSRPPPDRAAFLDEAKALQFEGVRVFAGDIAWADGQTPASALANIPALLQEVHQRGMYTYLVAITGSASGYNVEEYLRQVATECAKVFSCVLEVANEIGHSTQSSLVNDPARLNDMAKRVVPSTISAWSLGAMLGQDEMGENGYPPNGAAPFNTSHLDRGRDPWPEMIRRVREIAGISENTNKPAMSGEPIGAAEVYSEDRRSNDPNLFFTYGALCRMFEVGCVFHSEDGLFARPLRSIQKESAKQFIEGWKALATDARLSYQNSGWAGGDPPVASFTGATRVYSGINGSDGYTVVVGDAGVTIEWKNGWAPVGEPVKRPGAQVIHIKR